MSVYTEETVTESLKILLVDDDSFVREMLEVLFDREGCSLLFATNVVEATKIIATETPDIIITDAMMPGESGFSLIEKVRSDPNTRSIPIILFTILQQPDGSVMDASGMADISVSKPLYLSDIMSAMEYAKQLLEHRRVIKVKLPKPDDKIKTDKIEVVF